jgi:hypothetical protein
VSEPSTRRLVRSLVDELRPVRPLPPLRRALALVLVVGAVSGAIGLRLLGANPELLAVAAAYPSFAVIWAGLLVVAVGGVSAALAGAVPGREPEARVAFGVTAVGALGALGVGGALALLGPAARLDAAPAGAAGMCASMAGLLALPALAVAWGFVLRAAPGRPLACLAAAAAGAVALGAFANHMACRQHDALHLIFGHALAPAFAALLLSLPAWLWLRSRER